MAEILKPLCAASPDLDLISMLQSVRRFDAALYVVVDSAEVIVGAIVCRIQEFASSYRVFLVEACACDRTRISRGNMREIIGKLEAAAKVSECDAVRICGRAGWHRVFDGYHEVHSTYDKVIQEES